MAEPHLDIGGAGILRRLGHGPLGPEDRTGGVALDGAAAVEQHRQDPHRVGMAELGRLAQPLLGLGARDELRLARLAAVVGLVHLVELVGAFGVALRRCRAVDRDGLRPLPVGGERTRQRQLEPQIVRAGIGGLPADLDPALERLVARCLVEHVGRTCIGLEAVVRGCRMGLWSEGQRADQQRQGRTRNSKPGNGRAIEVSMASEVGRMNATLAARPNSAKRETSRSCAASLRPRSAAAPSGAASPCGHPSRRARPARCASRARSPRCAGPRGCPGRPRGRGRRAARPPPRR